MGLKKKAAAPDRPPGLRAEKMLTAKQLAVILNVSRKTIYGWVYRSVGIPHIQIGGVVRFREKEIEAYLKRKQTRDSKRNFEPIQKEGR